MRDAAPKTWPTMPCQCWPFVMLTRLWHALPASAEVTDNIVVTMRSADISDAIATSDSPSDKPEVVDERTDLLKKPLMPRKSFNSIEGMRVIFASTRRCDPGRD